MNHGTNHLGIDRSKTGGGRRRRMAAERRNQLRASNLYPITATQYGLYRDGDEWVLTALKARRTREKLVSDRRGGTETETVESIHLTTLYPTDGLRLETFDTKRKATSKYYTPDSWRRLESGEYWAKGEDCTQRTFKVDRDRWNEWANENR